MAEMQRFDPKTGNPVESAPAVLSGHFVSSDSNDLVFAYVNASQDPQAKALFVTVLHRLPEGYAIVFEKSLYFFPVQEAGLRCLPVPQSPIPSKPFIFSRIRTLFRNGANLSPALSICVYPPWWALFCP
jgi:hypothetical protein